MNITQAKYNTIPNTDTNCSINCTIDGNKVSVPIDPANTDFQAIQEWVAEGNTIDEAD